MSSALCRLLGALVVLVMLTGCARTPLPSRGAAPAGGAQPQSPIATPSPSLAIHEAAVNGDLDGGERGPTFRYAFDNAVWDSSVVQGTGDVLRFREDPFCSLIASEKPAKMNDWFVRTAPIGGRDWRISIAEGISPWVYYDSPPFFFNLAFIYAREIPTDAQKRLCFQVAEDVLATLQLSPDDRQTTADDPPVVPRTWLKSDEGPSGEPIIEIPDPATWLPWHSERQGLTFTIPTGWRADDQMWPTTAFFPLNEEHARGRWISLGYGGREMVPGESLVDRALADYADYGFYAYPIVVPVTLAGSSNNPKSQQVKAIYSNAVPGGEYLISHGQLVLHIETRSSWIEDLEILRGIADSVVFDDDAPMTGADITWRNYFWGNNTPPPPTATPVQ